MSTQQLPAQLRADGGLAVGAGALASGGFGAAVFLISGDPALAGMVAVAVAALAFVVARVGFRGALGALFAFLVGPGVFGETSFLYSLIGVLGLLAVCLSYRPTVRSDAGLVTCLGAFVLLPGVGMAVTFGAPVAGLFAVAALVGGLAVSRPKFVLELLGGITWVLGAFAASFVVTYLLGAFANPLAAFAVENRTFTLHVPFTVATGGEPFIPGTRRLAPLTGEPGLAAFYLAPLLAVVFGTWASRRRRIWTGVVLIAMIAFAQSLATVLAFAVAVTAGVIMMLARQRRYFLVAVLVGVAALSAPPVIEAALGEKATVAAASFTDRGIANLGNASAASTGNINLLVTFTNTPALALALSVALIFGAIAGLRTLPGAVAFAAFLVVVVAAQPSQWHPGAWLLMAGAMTLTSRSGATDGAQVRPARQSAAARS
ncbi:hypothetical protein ACLBWJ_11285 [Microbacterium sp. M4A5_1d]